MVVCSCYVSEPTQIASKASRHVRVALSTYDDKLAKLNASSADLTLGWAVARDQVGWIYLNNLMSLILLCLNNWCFELALPQSLFLSPHLVFLFQTCICWVLLFQRLFVRLKTRCLLKLFASKVELFVCCLSEGVGGPVKSSLFGPGPGHWDLASGDF